MIKTTFHGNTDIQIGVSTLGGDLSCPLVSVYLYGESDPRLELPIAPAQDETESLEQAARRSLKEFAEQLAAACERLPIDFSECE